MPNIRVSDPTRQKAYRLYCEVMAEHGERLGVNDYRVRQVAERFIRDMEKKGYRWAGGDIGLSPPQDWVDIDKPDEQTVIAARLAPRWRYLLDGLFWREESIYTEYLVDEEHPAEYPREVMEELYGRDYQRPGQ